MEILIEELSLGQDIWCLSESVNKFGIPMLDEAAGEGSIYTLILFDGCNLPEILHCSHFATDDLDKYDDIIKVCDEYFENGVDSRELVFDKKGTLGKEDQTVLHLTSGDPYVDLKDKLCEVAKYKYPKFIPHISVTENVDSFTGKPSKLVISKDGKEMKRYSFQIPAETVGEAVKKIGIKNTPKVPVAILEYIRGTGSAIEVKDKEIQDYKKELYPLLKKELPKTITVYRTFDYPNEIDWDGNINPPELALSYSDSKSFCLALAKEKREDIEPTYWIYVIEVKLPIENIYFHHKFDLLGKEHSKEREVIAMAAGCETKIIKELRPLEEAAEKLEPRFHWLKSKTDDGFEIAVDELETGKHVGSISVVHEYTDSDDPYIFEPYKDQPFYKKLCAGVAVTDIKHLSVESKFRGQGIAKYIYNLALAEIKKVYPDDPIFINASPVGNSMSLDDLVSFYVKAGFKLLKKYPEHRNAVLWLESPSKIKIVESNQLESKTYQQADIRHAAEFLLRDKEDFKFDGYEEMDPKEVLVDGSQWMDSKKITKWSFGWGKDLSKEELVKFLENLTGRNIFERLVKEDERGEMNPVILVNDYEFGWTLADGWGRTILQYFLGKKVLVAKFHIDKKTSNQLESRDDWKNEGYTLHYYTIPPHSGAYGKGGIVVVANDKDGNEAGTAEIHIQDDKYLFPRDLDVDVKHQRKGLATAMYRYAEKELNRKIRPSGDQSNKAKKLWKQKDRPFGESEISEILKKAKIRIVESRDDWKKDGYSIHSVSSHKENIKFVEDHPTDFMSLFPSNIPGDNSSYALKDGKIIGYAHFVSVDGGLIPTMIQVDDDHKRKGLASAMCLDMEHKSGKKVNKSDNMSDDGKAFWSQPNRPFGESIEFNNWAKPDVARAWEELYYLHDFLSQEDMAAILSKGKVKILSPSRAIELVDNGSSAGDMLSLSVDKLKQNKYLKVLFDAFENGKPMAMPVVDQYGSNNIDSLTDGRHRVLVASKLGIPVHVVVIPGPPSSFEPIEEKKQWLEMAKKGENFLKSNKPVEEHDLFDMWLDDGHEKFEDVHGVNEFGIPLES